jgi:anthranilate phosphoribosyltransferase
LGRGKNGSRSLTETEAQAAFGMILRGEALDLQVGAFLMLLRVKEESPEELTGFVQACRTHLLAPPPGLQADLDWSSYAGKKHQHPWYILSMLLLADAGYRVFVHGSAGHTAGRLYTETAFQALGLPLALSWEDTAQQLDECGLSYLSLEIFCPPLADLVQLKPLLGLRSPVNTLTRLLNPLRANASLQSVFHPAYARLHQEADLLLQQPAAMVFKGESGEIEIKPHADTRIGILQGTQLSEFEFSRVIATRVADVASPSVAPLRALWQGKTDDQYGHAAMLATATAALLILRPSLRLEDARTAVEKLWLNRNTGRIS